MGEFEMGAMMAVRAKIMNWELSFLVSIPSLIYIPSSHLHFPAPGPIILGLYLSKPKAYDSTHTSMQSFSFSGLLELST